MANRGLAELDAAHLRLPVRLHDSPFLHVCFHKWVWHGFDSLHGNTAMKLDSETTVMNSLFKTMKYSDAIVFLTTSWLAPSPPSFPTSPVFFVLFFSLYDGLVFSCWASEPLAIGAVQSCRSGGIRAETKIRDPHFRAPGFWCVQRKTSNGGLASDSYWCKMGFCVTEQAHDTNRFNWGVQTWYAKNIVIRIKHICLWNTLLEKEIHRHQCFLITCWIFILAGNKHQFI